MAARELVRAALADVALAERDTSPPSARRFGLRTVW